MRSVKPRNYRLIEECTEVKHVATLLKAGNLKKISGKRQHSLNISRNRVLTIILAFIVIVIGVISVFL